MAINEAGTTSGVGTNRTNRAGLRMSGSEGVFRKCRFRDVKTEFIRTV